MHKVSESNFAQLDNQTLVLAKRASLELITRSRRNEKEAGGASADSESGLMYNCLEVLKGVVKQIVSSCGVDEEDSSVGEVTRLLQDLITL